MHTRPSYSLVDDGQADGIHRMKMNIIRSYNQICDDEMNMWQHKMLKGIRLACEVVYRVINLA